jgi:hypothetical protein
MELPFLVKGCFACDRDLREGGAEQMVQDYRSSCDLFKPQKIALKLVF